jgi:hypothetical protein
VTRCAAPSRRLIDGSTIPSGTIDDLGVNQRCFAHQGYRLCARSARQGQVTLGARQGNEIDEPVPVICGPCPYNDRCLIAQRWSAIVPFVIISGRCKALCTLYNIHNLRFRTRLSATVCRISRKQPCRSPILVFFGIASSTEPALRLKISRHPFEARREIQKVSPDVW